MNSRELMNHAIEAQKNAFVPHSSFPVGAAILTDTGKVFTGCNIENPSFGVTVCAERCAIAKMIDSGERVIRNIAVVARTKGYCAPCGICLQAIFEFIEPDGKIIVTNLQSELKEFTLRELYPMPVDKK